MTKAVDKALTNRKIQPVEFLAIDEKSMARGHSYMTILTDASNQRVLDVVEDRSRNQDTFRYLI